MKWYIHLRHFTAFARLRLEVVRRASKFISVLFRSCSFLHNFLWHENYMSHRWTSSSSQQRSLSERIVICLIGVPLTESAQFSQPFVVSATMQLKKEDVHKLETFRSCQIRIFIHARIGYSNGLHCASTCFSVPSTTLKATKKSTSKSQAPRIRFMTFIQRRNRIGSPLQSEICSRISVAFI